MRLVVVLIAALLVPNYLHAESIIRGNIDYVVAGPIKITDYASVSGIITGDVTVASRAQLLLQGIINGDLIIEDGAEVVVTGIVNGAVINKGGSLDVSGVVSFLKNQSLSARSLMRAGSVLMGQKIIQDRSDF